jgi:DNA repair photolyase
MRPLLESSKNELYQLKVAVIGNNELIKLFTRKHVIKMIFLSENIDIYNPSAKIRSTGRYHNVLLTSYKSVQSQTKSDAGSSKSQ